VATTLSVDESFARIALCSGNSSYLLSTVADDDDDPPLTPSTDNSGETVKQVQQNNGHRTIG
jgi:hypothetical protein